jgi:hypothetical protein
MTGSTFAMLFVKEHAKDEFFYPVSLIHELADFQASPSCQTRLLFSWLTILNDLSFQEWEYTRDFHASPTH